MTDQPSKLTVPFDFDAPGKHCDYVRLPHSVHRSAYGWLPLPIVCISHGEGPTVLLMSGTHGDEYEGQVTLTRLARELEPQDIAGRVIIFPMANYPAAKAGLRTSPIDDVNLNRVFPGDPDGSPTLMIAHFIETVLMKIADFGLDLHSGGSSLHYLPTTVSATYEDETRNHQVREMMQVFGAPHSFFFPRGHAGGGNSNHASERSGLLSFTTEMGGSGTVTPHCLKICSDGVMRVLHHIGVLKTSRVAPSDTPSRMLHAPTFDYFTYASELGLFEPTVELGDEVKAGQRAGFIHTPETPWQEPTEMTFTSDGLVICKRIPGRVERGDCLFHLGTDLA